MNFQKRTLSNGITVLHESRNLPVVSLSISNPFGGAFENSEVKGVAHFIEHLLFTGTQTRSHEDISREIEKKGGVLNAFTAHEVTSYWFKLPSEHIFSGLDILTDMLNNPKFDEEKFEKEKKVILEEIKMYHDSPQRAVFEEIEKNLYDKPFGELIIGSKETVSDLSREDVKEIFEENYSPENYIVTIVGKADLDEVCKYLEEKFKKKNKISKIKEIKKINKETTEERPGIDQAHFIFAVHAPLQNTPEYTTLEVLDAYLANGMSSRLFLEIREKRGLVYSVGGHLDAEKSYSSYQIYAGTTKEAIPEVKEIILKEIENLQNMKEKDLEEAKQRLIGLRQVTSEESSNVMNNLVFSQISTNNAEEYYKHEEKINSVTLDQVKSLAETLFRNYSTAAIVPQ